MIVKYVRERGYKGRGKDPWITLGKTYVVLGIYFRKSPSEVEISIPDDTDGDPGVFGMKYFDIIDSRIPNDWIISYEPGNFINLYPRELSGQEDFWEKFHDGDQEAERLFKTTVNKIYKFHDLDPLYIVSTLYEQLKEFSRFEANDNYTFSFLEIVNQIIQDWENEPYEEILLFLTNDPTYAWVFELVIQIFQELPIKPYIKGILKKSCFLVNNVPELTKLLFARVLKEENYFNEFKENIHLGDKSCLNEMINLLEQDKLSLNINLTYLEQIKALIQ